MKDVESSSFGQLGSLDNLSKLVMILQAALFLAWTYHFPWENNFYIKYIDSKTLNQVTEKV